MAKSGSPIVDATSATTEGLDHLQTAAVELIAAARSFLDAAEIAIQNPDVVPQVIKFLSMLAKVPPITDDLITDDLITDDLIANEPTISRDDDELGDDNVVNIKSV